MKDPAFLFYTSDFLTGTMFMSNEQIGKYIRMLCAQHQHGHLTDEHMINMCGTLDPVILEKFKRDKDGLLYNKRLDFEIKKRNNFCESRRINRLGKNICKTLVPHMEDENEDENEDAIARGN